MSFAARRMGSGGGTPFTMVAGTGTYTAKVTFTDKGYGNASSSEGTQAGAFGSITPSAYNTATIYEVLWGPVIGAGTTGQVSVQLQGVLAANFITRVTCNGTDLGTVTQTSAGSGKSSWTVGSSSAANPFTTPGTYTIEIS